MRVESFRLSKHQIRTAFFFLPPLALWAALWLSLQPGSLDDIFNPTDFRAWVDGFRASLPYWVGGFSLVVIFFRFLRRKPANYLFLSPLGLAAVYGLVGIFVIMKSPSPSSALLAASAYLSVPLAVWAIVGGDNPLDRVQRLIGLNLVLIGVSVVVLFSIALFYLDLGSLITHPSRLLECKLNSSYHGQSWHGLTSFVLRPTGVGRYAAMGAIISLGMMGCGKWKFLWVAIFIAAFLLLLTSGARTAFIGFAVGAPLVLLLQYGKKAAYTGILALIVLVPVVLFSGVEDAFLDRCLRIHTGKAITTPVPDGPTLPAGAVTPVNGGLVTVPTNSDSPIVGESAQTPGETPIVGESAQTPGETPIVGESAQTPGETPPEATSNRLIFLTFSGRTGVWSEGFDLFTESPIVGYGFQADRLLLGTHAHNTLVHSLLQTGILGTIPLLASFALAWMLLINLIRKIGRLPASRKLMLIQSAGILAFLSVRSIFESTGAFFGVDWFFLAPLLVYFMIAQRASSDEDTT